MEEKKKSNLKISKIFILIGLVVIILGAVFLTKSIMDYKDNKEDYNNECARIDAEYNQAMAEYRQDYNDFRERFLNGEADISDTPVMPRKNTESLSDPKIPIMLPISIVIIVGGLSVLAVGLKPYTMKLSLKHKKETLMYTGGDITDIGNTIVDIGSPVVTKMVDDVVVPTVGKVKNVIVGDNKKTNDKLYCKYCGKLIDKDSKFCSKCGKEQ